jgi:hypothetical protein
MNANDKNVFVVRTIEDDDFAAGGRGYVCAPQKVVGRLFGGGLLERRDAAALWVHGAENVVDGAVFSSGVKGLKTDKERMAAFGVKQVLQLPELLLIMLDLIGRGLVVLSAVIERRVDLLELDLASRFDLEFLDVIHFESPFLLHCS